MIDLQFRVILLFQATLLYSSSKRGVCVLPWFCPTEYGWNCI